VSPPDADGLCSLGVESDYLWPALEHARVVLAEINPRVPFLGGDTLIPVERIDASIESDRPLPAYRREPPSATEAAIAERVVALVDDGACLQIGIGRFADAVMEALHDRRDLGVHSGMVGDVLLDLLAAGVISNRCKAIDEGLTVAGAVLGSERCLEMAAKEPSLVLRSIDHTHNPAVLGALDNLVSVNSAVEVDLFGQVNAETTSGRYVGAVGGSVDFMRAARLAPRGRSIVALPATSGRGAVSRIVPAVETVTALRSDVETVVTEYGTAQLRGLPLEDRVPLMIELAAPHHRDALRVAAKTLAL
jgi:acetyl-CoA hydrolase